MFPQDGPEQRRVVVADRVREPRLTSWLGSARRELHGAPDQPSRNYDRRQRPHHLHGQCLRCRTHCVGIAGHRRMNGINLANRWGATKRPDGRIVSFWVSVFEAQPSGPRRAPADDGLRVRNVNSSRYVAVKGACRGNTVTPVCSWHPGDPLHHPGHSRTCGNLRTMRRHPMRPRRSAQTDQPRKA